MLRVSIAATLSLLFSFAWGGDAVADARRALLVEHAGVAPVAAISNAAKLVEVTALPESLQGSWFEVHFFRGKMTPDDVAKAKYTAKTVTDLDEASRHKGRVEAIEKIYRVEGMKPDVFLITDGYGGLLLLQPNANGTAYQRVVRKTDNTVLPELWLFKVEK